MVCVLAIKLSANFSTRKFPLVQLKLNTAPLEAIGLRLL